MMGRRKGAATQKEDQTSENIMGVLSSYKSLEKFPVKMMVRYSLTGREAENEWRTKYIWCNKDYVFRQEWGFVCEDGFAFRNDSTNGKIWSGNLGMRMDDRRKLVVMEIKSL